MKLKKLIAFTAFLSFQASLFTSAAYAQKKVLLDTHFNHEVDKKTGKPNPNYMNEASAAERIIERLLK